MIPALIVFAYLAVVLYIGIFAFKRGKSSGEDYFLASRSLSSFVFLMSIFGTNMTAFAILGSSGLAYHQGIGIYGLMASSSGLVIPLTLFFIGTKLWSFGRRFGHMTQVQLFRDRWECSTIGTIIFAVTAAMLVPYILIGMMGGGATMEAISVITGPDGQPVMEEVMRGGKMVLEPKHWLSYELGGAIVAVVLMSYVFLGGLRGTAWVNTFQALLFLAFGLAAFVLLHVKLGGFGQIMERLAEHPRTASLLTRERMSPLWFFSYMFIPLSAIMFPHMAIMCFTAKKISAFKYTVVAYPLCIMAIWVPCVLLGVIAAGQFPGLGRGESDDVILRLLTAYTNPITAGVLGAGIMACVMASDSQVLALGTMFTEDVFTFYGGKRRFGEKAQAWTGRAFVILITLVAYLLAVQLKDKAGIFGLAIRMAFSGFAALSPVMIAALFWKRSTKWGALASTLWVAAAMLGNWYLYEATQGLAQPGQPPVVIFPALGEMLMRTPGGLTVYGAKTVMPMVLISAGIMVVVSWLTRPPSRATIDRYFPPAGR